MNEEETVVTPWEVKGKLDYVKLIEEFGTKPLTKEIIDKLKSISGGQHHLMIRRKLFFSHRDFDLILNLYEGGEKIVLYTGRGPSGPVHLGHYVPWIFTKYLQDVLHAKLYFQMTDDEKFLFHRNLTLKETKKYTIDNALDVIAAGFDPKKTKIIVDSENISYLYKIALKVAKNITFSTMKAVFGFKASTNIGLIFYPAIQAVPAFLEMELTGERTYTLIPCAIDQDPYWRITRDVAAKIGYTKPASIYNKFFPGLLAEGKMSSSIPESTIYMTDRDEDVKMKIMNAFTGGQPTIREQREKGGNPEICTVFQYLYFLFEPRDDKIREREKACRKGEILCGECKQYLIDKVIKFLEEHRKKRKRAESLLDKFLMK